MNPAQNLPWAAALDLLDKTSCLLIYRQDIHVYGLKKRHFVSVSEKSFPLSRLTPKMWVVLAEQGRH